jgi:hypothetical protein
VGGKLSSEKKTNPLREDEDNTLQEEYCVHTFPFTKPFQKSNYFHPTRDHASFPYRGRDHPLLPSYLLNREDVHVAVSIASSIK